jgi:hypothetical protein
MLTGSTHGIRAILSQKEGKNEKVITYASKGFSLVQKIFHSMEGEVYALVWGIMHFKYLYCTHFTLQTDHNPLEWLATISNACRRKGKWINRLQDFSFKMIHRASSKHTNVDALYKNLVDGIELDEDLVNGIQNCKVLQYIWKSGETLWMGRKSFKMCLLLQ